jgi:MFS family permease
MNIYQIIALVLPYSSGFKGARVLNTLYAIELGAGPFDIGLLLSTYALFPLLLAVYAGKVSDRYGVRIPMVGGMMGMTLGVFLPFAWPMLPVMFIGAAVTGAGFIFVQVSLQVLTGSLGVGEARTRNFNLYALAVASADFVGPVVAGFLIDHRGHVATYLYLSLFNLLALIGLLFLYRRIQTTASKSEDRKQQRMMDLMKSAELRRIFIVSAVVIAGLDLFQLYLPLYGHAVGLAASEIGMVLGAFAAAAFVVRAMLPSLARRYGEETTLIYSLYLAAATCLLVPFFSSALVLGAIAFVLGLGLGLGQPLSVMLTYNHSPPGRAGEALGLRIAINNSIHVVVPALFGAVGTVLGLGPVFWVNSAILAGGAYGGRRRKKP